jgi:hypothetical protein
MSDNKTRKRDRIKRKLKQLTEKDILVAMRDTLDNAYSLFRNKLGDYGVEVYKAAGGIGILTRLNEKFARLTNLLQKAEDPNCESIRDTIQDISVYATTLLAMIDKELVDLEELREQYRAIYGEIDEEKIGNDS